MEGDRYINSDVLTEINNRQKGLIGDFSEHSAIVVGLGGIGNWVAVDLALIGVGTLILFDNDKVEASNLNRTLFKLNHIGKPKVQAVKELISERRKDTIVITNEELFTVEHLQKFEGIDWVFDCSDTSRLKDSLSQLKNFSTKYLKLGYNGMEATLTTDFHSGQWGEDPSSYTIVPSFFGTPQILSALGIIELLLIKKQVAKTVNLNVKKILTQLSN
jgi:molybdopterin/thiamine biosynthesis adenylyltransferase